MFEPVVAAIDIAAICAELAAREPIFHHAEFGTTRADYAALMAPEFWEIGASGKRYTRDYVLDVLEQRHGAESATLQTRDFHCQCLAPDLYLLSYHLLQDNRASLRTTLWRRDADSWRIVFHQGTLVQATPDGAPSPPTA